MEKISTLKTFICIFVLQYANQAIADGITCTMANKGVDYHGKINVTKSGKPCQRWDSQSPHKHTRNNPRKFPDETLADAANYCRNPDGEAKPWCYTTTSIKWEFCDIDPCDIEVEDVPGFTAVKFHYLEGLNQESYDSITAGDCAQKCLDFEKEMNPDSCVSFDYDTAKHKCYISSRTRETAPGPKIKLKKTFVLYEKIFSDGNSVCTVLGKKTKCAEAGKEYCRWIGCCHDGNMCYESKSTRVIATCKEDCHSVLDSWKTGDLESKYFEVAANEAKARMTLPESLWTFLDAHPYIFKSLLSLGWPANPDLFENFHHLLEHYGEEKTIKYTDLFIATSFNRRLSGLEERPESKGYQSYWGYWTNDAYHYYDSDTRYSMEDLTEDQKTLMHESEDAAVGGEQINNEKRSLPTEFKRRSDIASESNDTFGCTIPYTFGGMDRYFCLGDGEYFAHDFCSATRDLDKDKRKITCRRNCDDLKIKDPDCQYPFTTSDGKSHEFSTGNDVPWCPVKGFDGLYKHSLDFYNFGSKGKSWDHYHPDPTARTYWDKYVRDVFKICKVSETKDILFPPRPSGANGYEAIDWFINSDPKYMWFPTFKAPWPLLLWLNLDIPLDECRWISERLQKNEKIITYSFYNSNWLNDQTYCRQSVWNPTSVPRIAEDGGICGQHSLLSRYSRICLGQPANQHSEPGHLALHFFGHEDYDEKIEKTSDILKGPWKFYRSQSLSNVFKQISAPYNVQDKWQLNAQGETVARRVFTEFSHGLTVTLNQGIDHILKGRMAINTYVRLPADKKDEALPLLVEVLKEQPYNIEIWWRIADIMTGSYFDNIDYSNHRYPKTCPDAKYDTLRQELETLLNESLLKKKTFPVTYVEAITRIIYPASCCAQHSNAQHLEAAAVSFYQYYGNGIGSAIMRMHQAVCAVKGNPDDPVEAVWEFVEPLMIEDGSLTTNEARDEFLVHTGPIGKTVDLLGDEYYEQFVPKLEGLLEKIPKIEVGKETFAFSPQYTALCNLYKKYNKKAGRGDEDGHALDVRNNEYLESLKTASAAEWQTQVDDGKVMGHYYGLVEGVMVYDAATKKLKVVDKPGEKECTLAPKGTDYVGHRNITKTGLPCQRWDSQTPHTHSRTNPRDFPDETLADAANYCRNPDGEPEPWCYTTTSKKYEMCNIKPCEIDVNGVPNDFKPTTSRFLEGVTKETYSNITVRECAVKCLDYNKDINPDSCGSFNYDAANKRCYINDKSTGSLKLSGQFIYYERVKFVNNEPAMDDQGMTDAVKKKKMSNMLERKAKALLELLKKEFDEDKSFK